ncbi:MAG: PEP-CTERM sorting domain-containing protein [Planctomycetota bacterium]|jgi:hypothetical protein
MKKICLLLVVAMMAGTVSANWSTFVIRENSTSGAPLIQANNDYISGATEFVTFAANQKAGWGSDDINGSTIADITQLAITRHDDTTRFAAGSGPAVAPYFNIWVTDGSGNYAVVANEPSNGAFQPLFTDNGDGSKTYDLSYTDLSDKVAKVYETPGWNTNSSWVHTMFGSGPLTFADVASLAIAPPPASYIQNGANGVGSGAPDVINTNLAYGFNWVFGDTLANYVSGEDGFIVSNPAAVPEPATMTLLALGGLLLRRKK